MNQRERFEEAWNSDGGKDGFPKYPDGSYSYGLQRVAFELFKKGEASGLLIAAHALRTLPHPPEIFGETFVVWELAIDKADEAIGALMAQGEKGNG